MFKIKNIFAMTMTLVFVGCGGSGSGSSNQNGTRFYSHSELAEIFVDRMNEDLGYDLELVKTNTRTYGGIVVYDYDYDSFDAYVLDNGGFNDYEVGEDLEDWLDDNPGRQYFFLEYYSGSGDNTVWIDPITGTLFDKTQLTTATMDVDSLAMAAQEIEVEKAAEHLYNNAGVGMAVATDMAKTIVKFKALKNPDADQVDETMAKLTGMTYTQIVDVAKTGDEAAIDQAFAEAARTMEIAPGKHEQFRSWVINHVL